MRKKIVFFFIVGSLIHTKLSAQASFGELENNKVLYPSPTAASLGKYGEYPVNLYNGLVNIGQDIVTVKSGHLSLDVSLSYHASGNRPSDIPGWVGLGFSLNAGGVITRVIKDLADDATGGFYMSNTSVQYLWNNYPNSQFVEQYFDGTTDPRSDEYQFNFAGYTGEFVFDWNRNIHFKQLTPFKVDILGMTDGFSGFVITTEDGTTYRFDQTEKSQLKMGTGVQFSPASAWYLTKIKNLNGDSIVLHYTSPMNKYRYKQYSTRKEVAGSMSDGNLMTGPTINLNTSADEVVYLDDIVFNEGKLTFAKSTRQDPVYVPNGVTADNVQEKKLDLITLLDNSNNLIKQWKFEYFENSTERLKLKNLIVKGSAALPSQKYSFEYDPLLLPLPLPGPSPNVNPYLCDNVDYWGYYNNASNSDNKIPKMFIPEYNTYYGQANRSILPSFVKAEMLEKITYPTGGYTTFEYESNDYSSQGESFAANQNPLTATDDTTDGYQVIYNRDDGGFEQDPATMTFTLYNTTHINVTYSCGADGPNHAWANPGTTYNYDYQAAPGTYTVQGILNTNVLLQPGSADITKATGVVTVYKVGTVPHPIKAKIGPGLRIKSISNNDGVTTTKKTFEYRISQDPDMSSGVLSVFPAFYVPLPSFASNLQGLYVASDPINDLGDGLPVGYSRVVERFQDNSSIVHTYTTYDDHPDEIMPFTNSYSNSKLAHMTSNDFWRGQETTTSTYNAAGTILKRVTKNYDVLPESITDVQCIELKPTVSIEGDGGQPNNINGTLTSLYNVHSCFLYNTFTIEERFDKDGVNVATQTTGTSYDNVKHLKPTRVETTTSDGSVVTNTTSYPDDYAAGTPFIDYMQANHLISFPIEQVTYRYRDGATNIASGNIITYKTTGAGLPDQLLKLETANPIPQSSFSFSNRSMGILPPSSTPAQYTPDTRYKPAITYSQYDSKGNPTEITKRSGIKTSYLWGYNQVYPVAEIVGADYATASGKITNPSTLNAPASDAALRNELNNLRTIGGATVSTYTFKPLIGMTSETDPRGFTTYYEYDGLNRLLHTRDKDGNVMKKYDYNNLYHQTVYYNAAASGTFIKACSSTENGSSVTYTVPAGAYPSTVSQADADAQATADVNANGQSYANANGTCTPKPVFHNVAASGTFTKACSSTENGSSVTYTVTAGTYSSIVSQADADAQAAADVNANGQSYANTNGTCTPKPVYHSVEKSGTFTKACGGGYSGSDVTYTVAAGTYSSLVSQADADAQAVADVNANGQNYANAHGTCLQDNNDFDMESDFVYAGGSLSSNGSTVTGSLTFTPYGGFVYGVPVRVAEFRNEAYIPSSTQTWYSGSWQITITPSDEKRIMVTWYGSGTPPAGNITINISYQL